MRRTASEIIHDLEIRVAHLERVASWTRDIAQEHQKDPNNMWSSEAMKKSHRQVYRKALTKFLLELDERAEGEYAIDDLGLGDYLNDFQRRADRYYNISMNKLLASTGLPKEVATLENYLNLDERILNRLRTGGLSLMISHTLQIMFHRYENKANKSMIFEIASEMLKPFGVKALS